MFVSINAWFDHVPFFIVHKSIIHIHLISEFVHLDTLVGIFSSGLVLSEISL